MPAVIFGVMASAFVAPCLGDEFCEKLSSVIASAPRNFEAVRGQPEENNPATFMHPVTLPGATKFPYDATGTTCNVHRPLLRRDVYMYTCSFPGPGYNLEPFITRIASCYGITPSINPKEIYYLPLKGVRFKIAPLYPLHGGAGILYIEITPDQEQ